MRGHGESDGEFFTYGAHEWQDVVAVIDHLAARSQAFVVLGASAGGAVAIRAAAEDSRIRGVITIGTFADLASTIADQTPMLPDWWWQRAIAKAEQLGDFSV